MSRPYYEDRFVTLWHGDSLDVTPWLGAAFMLTDPPYGIDWKKSLNRRASSRAHAGIQGDKDTSARDRVLHLWDGRPAAVFGSLYAPFPSDLRHILVWQKPNDAGVVGSTTGYRRDVEAVFLVGNWPKRDAGDGSVIRSHMVNVGGGSSPAGRTGHPHSKPVDLLCGILERAPAGMVADPFAGSGSTLCAAKMLGRRAVGVEIEEAYCEIIASRLSQNVLELGDVA